MANTLVSLDDVRDFPGGPFNPTAVDIAAAAVRAAAGWHIAPVLTETITVQSWGERELILPTMRIVSVSAVRYGGVTYTSSWTVTPSGLLRTGGYWPMGPIEVDLTHGYAKTPLDLLPVIVDYVRNASNPRDPSIATQAVGQVSVGYREAPAMLNGHPLIGKYAIPGGVA